MPVKVRCPNPACNKTYQVAEELLGRRFKCKACGQVFESTSSGPPSAENKYPSISPTTEALSKPAATAGAADSTLKGASAPAGRSSAAGRPAAPATPARAEGLPGPTPPYRHLHVAWNPRNEVAVARVTQAKIDSGNVEAIGDDLLKLAAEVGNRKLLINMEGVEFIFSTALGKLLATEKKITGQGGRLRLCRLCPLVLDTFQKSGLTFVFEIYRDEEHGLAGW